MKITKLIKQAAAFALALCLLLPAGQPVRAASGNSYRVNVAESYLALRSAKAYARENELGELYNTDTVLVYDTSDDTYWYVYSPKYDMFGYVNKNYLVKDTSVSVSAPSTSTWTVSVTSGYLALRSGKAFLRENELGELYTGDTVDVYDTSDDTYWYVYSPKLGKYGYVNKDYLVGTTFEWTVRVETGYLALRTAKAYDAANEIGKLYTGDTVQIDDDSDPAYWYVYSPKLGKFGYVNKDYLVPPSYSASTYVPAVTDDSAPILGDSSGYWSSIRRVVGYVVLRNAMTSDNSSEIGRLYTGDSVQVLDDSDSTYCYVYCPDMDKYGYINKVYLAL